MPTPIFHELSEVWSWELIRHWRLRIQGKDVFLSIALADVYSALTQCWIQLLWRAMDRGVKLAIIPKTLTQDMKDTQGKGGWQHLARPGWSWTQQAVGMLRSMHSQETANRSYCGMNWAIWLYHLFWSRAQNNHESILSYFLPLHFQWLSQSHGHDTTESISSLF